MGIQIRLVVEKPQGHDLESYQKLRKTLLKPNGLFEEHEIYQMDHYLGKLPVQNIPLARSCFEDLFEDKTQIKEIRFMMNETVDCRDRGSFYESCGVIRDAIQNHVLQMFALFFVSDARDTKAKAEILQSTKVELSEHGSDCLLAQYESYRGPTTKDVHDFSVVPTYARVRVTLNHAGWKDVKMYLESGKALATSRKGVLVTFKNGGELFIDIPKGTATYTSPGERDEDKVLELNEDPQGLWQGIPGKPYGTLLLHAFDGNRSSFVSTPEVEAQWNVVDPLLTLPATKKYTAGADPATFSERIPTTTSLLALPTVA